MNPFVVRAVNHVRIQREGLQNVRMKAGPDSRPNEDMDALNGYVMG